MKLLLLLLIFITAIQFQLNFIGTKHEPNFIKVYSYGREIETISRIEKIDGKTFWRVYSEEGELISFLNFWEE